MNQKEWWRDARHLFKLAQGNVRVGLSLEPLIGRVDLGVRQDYEWMSILVAGGESRQRGAQPRRMPEAWVEDLLAFARSADVPFHMKQMADGAEIPPRLMVREFPRGWGPA